MIFLRIFRHREAAGRGGKQSRNAKKTNGNWIATPLCGSR